MLACGDGTVLSHRSAAALWRLLPAWPARIEVTARHRHRLRGVHAHRSRTLQVADAAIHHGIPVTAPARTLLDLADVLGDRRLARAVNEAQVLGWVRADELAALLDRSPGRRGSGRLRSQLSQRGGPTRSELEDCFLAFVREHGLPRPEVNRRVAGYEVDMLWRPERLVVELDGRAFHAHRFERDRVRGHPDHLAAARPRTGSGGAAIAGDPRGPARAGEPAAGKRRGRDSNPRWSVNPILA